MQLHHHEIGQGEPIIILHGLFGSSDNWLTIAKQLATTYKVYLPDQRNHGRSPWSEEFTYEAMSDDLMAFIREHRIQPPVLIGHSMGGKTAMRFAMRYPGAFRKLLVVDIAPKYYPPHHQEILEGLRAIDLTALQTRQQADEQLARHIPEAEVRQFLLKNLYRAEGGPDEPSRFAWRLNLPVIEREIERVGEALSYSEPVQQPTLFLRGGKSRYIKDPDMNLIQQIFPRATLQTIADAGHWVHAEQPKEFVERVREFVEK
ncbi:MAG: alpha/beta fold hydrolase [Ferruginibacter sp.]|nr:alpha/beta fold hydrolase [Cytophagales bacterium]